MRFLHTADWHLGKQLHKQNMGQDMDLFFSWMTGYIVENDIRLLIVAGDIFDMANPSNEDRKRYYHILGRLAGQCKLVITGGNHDSVTLLDAPTDLLSALDITVVGGIDSLDIDREIVPIYDGDEIKAIVLAVPYLRDRDVRSYIDDSSSISKIEAMRSGIIHHYTSLIQRSQELYGRELPIIGMGHLWLHGASTSDSEREITVGNLSGVDYQHLTEGMDYMALGHIHRPQSVGVDDRIRYSGSPIPLSFSERNDQKIVVAGEITQDTIITEPVAVPIFRSLKTISGSVEEVATALSAYHPDTPLPSWVELHITEDSYDPTIVTRLASLRDAYANATFKIIKERITYRNSPTKITELYTGGTQIEDLTPQEVFAKRLETATLSVDEIQRLKQAHEQVLASVYESGGE